MPQYATNQLFSASGAQLVFCWSVAVSVARTWPALVGFGLIGVGGAVLYPLMVSAAARLNPFTIRSVSCRLDASERGH